MLVRATAVGYFGVYRQPGDIFEVPDDAKPATWFEPVQPAEPVSDEADADDVVAARGRRKRGQ